MKVILVIDEPENCEKCRVINSYYDNEYGWQTYCGADNHRIREKNKKYFCPLRPIPKKKKTDILSYRGLAEQYRREGWNECIDEILGE